MKERTITINGTGTVSAQPDEVLLTMEIASKDYYYQKATAISLEYNKEVTDALIACGIDRDDLKTSSYNINAQYENERNDTGVYTNVFKGYECRQELSLSIPMDTILLGKVIESLSACKAAPRINIQFTVGDQKSLRDELLCSAAENALHKAQILTKATNVNLGELYHIEHTVDDEMIVSPTHIAADMWRDGIDKSMSIVPEDINISETVRFTWLIV